MEPLGTTYLKAIFSFFRFDCTKIEQKSIEKREEIKKVLDELQEQLKVFIGAQMLINISFSG